MAELRSVDPRILLPNPNNPRTTPVPPAMDEQLVASIKAVGIIQPPSVTPKDDKLIIALGNRRVKAAYAMPMRPPRRCPLPHPEIRPLCAHLSESSCAQSATGGKPSIPDCQRGARRRIRVSWRRCAASCFALDRPPR